MKCMQNKLCFNICSQMKTCFTIGIAALVLLSIIASATSQGTHMHTMHARARHM